MAIEIERKFRVKGDAWRTLGEGIIYRQGYLLAEVGRTVRVRIAGNTGYLTIKGATNKFSRPEFEYPIPSTDAEELLEMCDRPLIEKIRYRVPNGSLTWEIDEFFGENQGLIVAEIELKSAEQQVELPEWIGEEVTHDPRYYNANLAKHPYTRWS
jgi:adenylate cyclase